MSQSRINYMKEKSINNIQFVFKIKMSTTKSLLKKYITNMSHMADLSEVPNYSQSLVFFVTTQPKQNFHYRYVAELKNSHGYLTGQQLRVHQSNTTGEIYPSVKLVLPKDGHLDDFGNKRDFCVLCTIHNNDDKCLSPHLLLAKGETKANYNFIFEKMKDSSDNALERYWDLEEYVIVRLKTEEFKKSLKRKAEEYEKLQLPMEFRLLQGDLDLNDEKCVKSSGNLNVCLGFTLFEKDFYSNTYRLYKETIFSNNIYHGDDIKIHHLCNTKGSITGGTKITILIKLNSNFPLNVLITRINEKTKQTDWRIEIPIKNEDIFGKHAITFVLPPYEGPKCTDDEIEVNIEVVVTGTTYKSQNVKFYYLNNTDDSRPRKRARNSTEEELKEEVSSSTSSLNNDATLNNFNFQNESYMVTPAMQPIALPSITNYEPNPDLDITSIINHMGTNDFSDDTLLNTFIYNTQYFDSNNEFEYISRDRIALQHEEISENEKHKMLPLHNEVIETSLKMKKLKLTCSIAPITKIKLKIDKIFNMPIDAKNIDISGLENKTGNTIFHEALSSSESLIYLYKLTKNSPHRELVIKARNKNWENLLHYAFKQNKFMFIRPLIGMGCCVHEQDNYGRTPLHIAMEHNYTDCILKLQQLLKDHSKYPEEVRDSLIKMFKVYNHNGHTVLHAAVLEQRLELVEIMLEFCRRYKINVIDYEVLGNGDSIVHLVVKNNLIQMVKLIQKYIPYYLTIQNYPGVSVLDLPDTSKEMLQALNVK